MAEGFGPDEPEYSGRDIKDQARVLWKRDLSLSQSTQGERFRPEPEYSGRVIWPFARGLWERDLDLRQIWPWRTRGGHSQRTCLVCGRVS